MTDRVFVLVEVRGDSPEQAARHAGILRKAIHVCAAERKINQSDMIYRPDSRLEVGLHKGAYGEIASFADQCGDEMRAYALAQGWMVKKP